MDIARLEQLILKHKAYYYQGRPQISDHEYDDLEKSLRKLNPNSFVLNLVGSDALVNKIEHQVKMLSLDKTYSIEDLKKWTLEKPVICTYKVDGTSCSLRYQDGKLKIAATRGNGKEGEDITLKAAWIESIKKELSEDVEIRGEIFCYAENFYQLADEMVSLNLQPPSSTRNIVSGLLLRKDNIELCRYLSFVAFDVIGKDFDKEIDKYQFLEKLEFNMLPYKLIENSDKLEIEIDKCKEFISKGDFPIDGLVFAYNDLSFSKTLGITSHHPRYKMAFKFAGETAETEILEILWQVSRNGVLTPVALVTPVVMSGAKISRVTLHNFGVVQSLNLKKGDIILIIRSGEVIPKFLELVKGSQNKFDYPKKCPICESATNISGIRLFCTNAKCDGKEKEVILNFITKMNIEDISSKRLEELMKLNLVKDISDLYKLKMDDLLALDKFKEKLANKVYQNIQNSKNTNLITFLSALGISGVAYNSCEKIVASGYNTIDKILKLTVDELIKIPSFAIKSATSFVESLNEKRELVDNLIKLGITFSSNDQKLEGLKVVITGSLSIPRSQMENIIRKLGGIVTSSVTKETSMLIANEVSSSGKYKKALDLNISIITEVEFNKKYLL